MQISMRNTLCRLGSRKILLQLPDVDLCRSDTTLSEAMKIVWKAGVSGVFLQEWRCVEGRCRVIILAQTKKERNTLTTEQWWSALPCVYSFPNRWCGATAAEIHEHHPPPPKKNKRGSAQRKFVWLFVEPQLPRNLQRTFQEPIMIC